MDHPQMKSELDWIPSCLATKIDKLHGQGLPRETPIDREKKNRKRKMFLIEEMELFD